MSMELIEAIATRIGWAILHSLWQGALLGLAAAGILLVVRGAAVRHAIGLASLLGMGVILIANALFPTVPSPRMPELERPIAATEPIATSPIANTNVSATPVAIPISSHEDGALPTLETPAPQVAPTVSAQELARSGENGHLPRRRSLGNGSAR